MLGSGSAGEEVQKAGWEVTGLDGGVLRGAYARWIFKTLTLYSNHKTQKVARFHRRSYDALQKK